MDARKRVDSFHLNDQGVVDEKIDPECAVDFQAFVDDRQGDLAHHHEAAQL